MKLESVGKIIATRDLDLEGGEPVLVTIGAPTQTPGHADYYCPSQLPALEAPKSDMQ